MIANTEPQRIGKLSLEKRGEPGTRLQASPGPRTATDLNQKSGVVA
jgi:hypothetical protein